MFTAHSSLQKRAMDIEKSVCIRSTLNLVLTKNVSMGTTPSLVG